MLKPFTHSIFIQAVV